MNSRIQFTVEEEAGSGLPIQSTVIIRAHCKNDHVNLQQSVRAIWVSIDFAVNVQPYIVNLQSS